MRANTTSQTVLYAILLLFFLQVLSDFVESIYSFGLLITGFPIQLAAMLLLFAPAVLLLIRSVPGRPWFILLAAIALLGALIEPLMDPGNKLVAAGVSVGAFLLLFPILIASRPRASIVGWRLATGLMISVAFIILVRSRNSGAGASELGIYGVITLVLAALALRLIWDWEPDAESAAQGKPSTAPLAAEILPGKAASYAERREQSLRALGESSQERPPASSVASAPPKPSNSRIVGLSIGLIGVVAMLYLGFTTPAVIARWTGYPYAAIVTVLLAALTVFGLLLSSAAFVSRLTRPVVLVWNALFILLLVLTILPHQVTFPRDLSAYPLDAPAVSPLAQIPLYLMLLFSPVIFLDFMIYARQLSADSPSIRQLGGGFALAALYLLLMIFFHVFTTVYDYAGPIGEVFRDRFWFVYLLAGLGLALPLLLVRTETFELGEPALARRFTPTLLAGLSLLSVVAVLLTASRPAVPQAAPAELRVMTYNIQQGFDKVGAKDLDGQLAAMRRVAPDILGLEESDTARLSSGNVDAVRYFADALNMYSYYGPATTTGTFGIALLSKYPIRNAHTFFLYSIGEQTAAIHAQITVNGRTYNIFVTHLGNDGPMTQLQDLLKRVDELPNVILVGDFNFDPTTQQYTLAASLLKDAWRLRWPAGRQLSGPGAEGRIDLIFVSPGTQVTDSEYVPNPSSDHPYLYAVIKP